jgi:alpha-D-xyloside xylohydrolase
MKFNDGFWDMRAGVTPHFAAEAYEVLSDATTLTVYAPTRRIVQRGDTLNLPVITVKLFSPASNIIGVRLTHFAGGRPPKPEFELFGAKDPEVQLINDTEQSSLTSGQLTARFKRKAPWALDFLDGNKVITRTAGKGSGYADTPQGRFMLERLMLSVGECVYGLGERFTPFVKNGQAVDLWNEDGGTASEQTYKNIPFYLTNRGYGIFINHPERVQVEVASETVESVQFSVPGESLEYFVIYGPTPKEVLQRYTALTGRPALPPAWTFGLWLTTSFTTNYDTTTVNSFIQGMADRDIPLHVFHFDCFWMKEFHWVDFLWDERVFPDPAGMLRDLKARGLKICVWINSYVGQQSAMFEEGKAGGYLLKRPNGEVWQWDKWQAGMGLVDFTNPDACKWYGDKLRALIDMGVDCFKTDFGERIPTDVVYFDGSDPVKMHNYYTFLYNKVVFEVLEEKLGIGEAALFARSATTGSQQFPVHWGGDSMASFESMAETLRGGLSLALSGFGFWSHDIGGFEQTATAALYKRWCAFGLLSSHSRLHGSQSYRVPWLFDEEAVDVLRYFTKLKCRLMPYLFGKAVEAHQTGTPILRAMVLEFPDDPACEYLDRQYMLGDDLLVAPVFTDDGQVSFYVPEGRWTNFLSGKTYEGGRWYKETHPYLSLPLLARPGAVIPLGSNDTQPDYDFADGVTFHVFELADGATTIVEVPTTTGETALVIEVNRSGNEIKAKAEGSAKNWKLLLRGVGEVVGLTNGASEKTDQGTLVTPEAGQDELTITLN